MAFLFFKFMVSANSGKTGGAAYSQIEVIRGFSLSFDNFIFANAARLAKSWEAEHYIAFGEIAKAEKSAKDEDSSGVAESLTSAGKWALDVAAKIGTSLATEAIKKSMEI